MNRAMLIKAPAKINLGLTVLRRRPDGYHDLLSVMQQLSLADTILLEPQEEPGWRFFCSEPSLSGEDNLVCRAAALLAEKAGLGSALPGVKMSLFKNIPVAAGLGGGSSDAAAALKGLNSYWGLGLSFSELLEAGAQLGSDVPFCLLGGTALAQGRGEKVAAMPGLPFHWVILAMPPEMHLSTAQVYGALEPAHLLRPRLEPLIEAIRERSKRLLHLWFAGESTNTLEAVVMPQHLPLQALKREFLNLGLHPAMSGSGPSMFALCDSLVSARVAARALEDAGNRVFLCWTKSNP
ncbi:MAG TPA: 4-(cytidine 5'-diphospho)-2-C-methyl-D-erythritol kinase [Bacillota bacterium]|jgi:4-diphosphocytidyl-2-C-methyl-D-erythritol kinase|nr:4-(cytidine 5'-diphospho)-2-C-methyl-D-erythritol kinase [Bacillota bacterium]HOA34913.1 4-(cytidine 5'-diphospho)-2-C-methyl-D-erythritol kinase [Bacillota bacterium]HOJ83743.1 4-(cytidine 5'-diphospho)-2-C-methyl-D-erythritol kinase [Bacillota bacterium]HOL14623.1 4-(cytidine 5'-diphospho)-2-C-methyl-D-erythritol kinase [Bacillota bacterium]HPZ10747.1 4-(cytidine 5'-diphospho)-2-C-methyl-D-erythritol kinase [Bacillota bacterium]